jgi:hypothetical protein
VIQANLQSMCHFGELTSVDIRRNSGDEHEREALWHGWTFRKQLV